MLPHKNSEYHDQAYWNKRYEEEKDMFYDWFSSSIPLENLVALLVETIFEHFSPDYHDVPCVSHRTEARAALFAQLKILVIGCGNSRLGELLVDQGFSLITNIDYSNSVIEKMQNYYKEHPNARYRDKLVWMVQDIRAMSDIKEDTFHVVLDKATLDVFFTASPHDDPWNPSAPIRKSVLETLTQVQRVLKRDAKSLYLYLTWGQPHFRKPLLIEHVPTPWSAVSVKSIGDSIPYFLYILTL